MTELSTSLLEKFIIADNKSDVLKDVTPQSNLYKFIEVMIALNAPAGDAAHAGQLAKEFRASKADSTHKNIVYLKHLLDQLSAARGKPEEVKKLAGELNTEFLNYSFDATNPFQAEFRTDLQEGEGSKPASGLSDEQLKSLSLQTALDEVYSSGKLDHLKPSALENLDLARLDFNNKFDEVCQILEQNENINSLKNLKTHLSELMKQERGVQFVKDQIWPKLSVENREALLLDKTPLSHNLELWMNLLQSMFELGKLSREDAEAHPEELIEEMEKALVLTKHMPPKFAQFRRTLNLQLIKLKTKIGKLDKKTLIEYLKDPVASSAPVLKQPYNTQLQNIRNKNNEERVDDFPPGEEDAIVRKALTHVLRDASDYKDFEEYLDSTIVARIFYEQKLLKGEDAAKAKDYLSESQLQSLFNERRLRFFENNKKKFGKGDKVEVNLEVKNVSNLIVRVFEVSTLNYVLENNNLNFERIDTAGLIPSSEFRFKYTQSPMVAHHEKFQFNHIESVDRGVFILDFIGEEVKTRAVISKGHLSLMYDQAGGRTAVILDQDGNVCKGDRTGIYVEGVFVPAKGENGEITLPESILARSWSVTAVHNGFASLCDLQISDPCPCLTMNVLFNSETFQAGNTVTLIIEPKLQLFSQTSDLSQLRNIKAEVKTFNDQGVPNITSFPDLKIVPGEDLTVSFIFPAKVRSFNVDLSADFGEKDKKQRLSAGRAFNIKQEMPDVIQSILIQKHAANALRLFVVGRNGEPRRNQEVIVRIGLKHLREEKTFTLVTDERGVIDLGVIKDLEWVNAEASAARVSYNPKEEFQTAYPLNIDLKEDETLKLPINAEFDKVTLGHIREGTLLKEFPAGDLKRSSGVLTLPGLKEGTYLLTINDHRININVFKGTYIDGKKLLKTKDSIIALPGDAAAWFQNKRDNANNWEVKVASKGQDLKVRLLTFNYLPNELQNLVDNTSGFIGSDRNNLANSQRFASAAPENVYSEQVFLGDEIAYVYDRKSKKSFIGNTLEKPGVILKRNRLGETTETEQNAREGEKMKEMRDRKGAPKPMMVGASYAKNDMMYEQQYQSYGGAYQMSACPPVISNEIHAKDYLAKPGKLVTGLKAENGVISIPKTLTADYPYSYLSISDGHFTSLLPLEHDYRAADVKDITLQKSRKEGFIYSYGREVKFAAAGQATHIPNVENTQLFMITSLKEFWDAILTLAPSLAGQAAEWDFLPNWHQLKPMEKLKKYDKYASHELNLFVYCKDTEFFEGVVRPHLKNKREKQVVDYFLLGEIAPVANKVGLPASQNLAFIERVLLATLVKSKWPEFGRALLNYARSYNTVYKATSDDRKRWFETLMNVNSEGHAQFDADRGLGADEADGMVGGGGGGMEFASMSNIAPMSNVQQCEVVREVYMECAKPRVLRSGKHGAMKKCAPRKKMAKMEKCMEEAECDDDYGGEDSEGDEDEKQQVYTPSQGTIEYNERQYFSNPGLFNPCEFWADLLQHLTNHPTAKGFCSTEFLSGIDSLCELIVALAFTDLPFEKVKVTSSVKGSDLTLTAPNNYILLVKEVIEKKGEALDIDVQCSQKIYDPNDPVIYDDEDKEIFYDKPVDEFLTGKSYAVRVVITNSSSTQAKVNLITEVPEGSLPLNPTDFLTIKDLTIQPFHSEVVQYNFYFPKVGTFDLFPATVVKGDKIVATAKKLGPIQVKSEKSARGLQTISDVLANGNIADIVEFMKTKNLLNSNVFSFHQIYWLLKNREFYEKAIGVCEEKGIYDDGLWSYSIYHGDYQRLRELLQAWKGNGRTLGPLTFYDGDVYQIDQFNVREYYPLINPRAHVLGSATTNIINNTFKNTYTEFLMYLFQKFRPNLDDYVLLINYLIAQDQIEKALDLTNRLAGKDAQVTNHIQFEYQTAYLSFITGYPDFTKAKAICEKYLAYPVLSWRNLFVEMANQLSEFEESDQLYKTGAKSEGEALNKDKAKNAASFTAALEGQRVKIVSYLTEAITLRLYMVELEVVFSMKPFEFDSKKEFMFVAPFYETTVLTHDAADMAVTYINIPEGVVGQNLFIEARAATDKLRKSEYLTYIPFKLNCFVTKEFGILKCFEPSSSKPVPRIYVKCFAKYNDGSVKFYKDGYTDLRGSFDYVSLNTDKIDNIQSFAILVTSLDYGSKVIVESPPAKIGTAEGQAKQLISDAWAQRREQNVQIQQKSKAMNQYLALY